MLDAPVAVDAMGGDHAPQALVEGALLARSDGIPVCLVGDAEILGSMLPPSGPPVIAARGVVGMGESPVAAVRRSDDLSVRVALREVRVGRACAAVSCGHTGALLVAAVFDLGTVEGVERPAIATVLPRADGGRLILLDAGANIDCKPELLVSFARLGVDYARVLGVASPRVGLLSNGEEDGKGNAVVRATLPLLQATGLDVVGNVEPTAAMSGGCEVLVTDGFVGNVLIKAAEGAVQTAVHLLREEIQRSRASMFGAWLLRGAIERFRVRIAWDAHGGGVLLGTRGTVVVGHGRANPEAVRQAIHLAHSTAGGQPAGGETT
ncbi:MAG TPA: phosphate acyltransferase PlsX [Deltaproteobacteria bacterium]|nr:phosphate acyltransferase PlsX [Deltaproteobacteria bacterium]